MSFWIPTFLGLCDVKISIVPILGLCYMSIWVFWDSSLWCKYESLNPNFLGLCDVKISMVPILGLCDVKISWIPILGLCDVMSNLSASQEEVLPRTSHLSIACDIFVTRSYFQATTIFAEQIKVFRPQIFLFFEWSLKIILLYWWHCKANISQLIWILKPLCV